jgi:hypothetical protein
MKVHWMATTCLEIQMELPMENALAQLNAVLCLGYDSAPRLASTLSEYLMEIASDFRLAWV